MADAVARAVERPATRGWWVAFLVALAGVATLVVSLADVVAVGTGEWGLNHAVGWAWDITGFVFWIGIAHAGTLLSAVLFLLRQKWRGVLSRAAEAVTVFAVLCAFLYPLFHTGRPWVAWAWMLPIPNQMGTWPNFRSPLTWDLLAVGTYGVVSVMFWYVGMVPDLAGLRDRATTRGRYVVYGILALGWRGSAHHWARYEKAYLYLAALATPLVVSVHSVVSMDFAVSNVPAWHSTIFPPYFVAGAVLSGMAMVLVVVLVCRRALGLESWVTVGHLDSMNKVLLAAACFVAYSHVVELHVALGSGEEGRWLVADRAGGPYGWAFWSMVTGVVVAPQVMWLRGARRSVAITVVVAVVVNVGMWLERFVIIAGGLARGPLTSSWDHFQPRLLDVTVFLGTLGLFFACFLLFVRFVPFMPVAEAWDQDHPAGPVVPARTRGQARTGAGGVLLVGALPTARGLREACGALLARGGLRVEAYSPYPLEGLGRQLGARHDDVGWWTAAGGLLGVVAGFALPWWTMAVDYPLVLSGRPGAPWMATLPVCFELGVLGAAVACFVALWRGAGLPRPFHPVMKHPRFPAVAAGSFLVSVELDGPVHDVGVVRAWLEDLGVEDVVEVAP
jgi:molybdopterin-containing oxidoreductase family membrane subunit